MKKSILTIIAIAILGCNESAPLTHSAIACPPDQWDEAYDAGVSDSVEYVEAAEQRAEECEKQIAEATEYPVDDWQARTEYCEPELLNCRANRDLDNEAFEGLSSRATDLRDGLRYFDLTEPCDQGLIAQWICDAFFSHNL